MRVDRMEYSDAYKRASDNERTDEKAKGITQRGGGPPNHGEPMTSHEFTRVSSPLDWSPGKKRIPCSIHRSSLTTHELLRGCCLQALPATGTRDILPQ
ncbi:hypothetical protein WN55_10410 [Dufourea novaeangliae]|uniref:Uncharacterized protein n=1 Tax=Dufourea novaeangliae TaxID=178035 RepID=A0A154P3I3_DUFNO|nr:hypothetical protein WN55_10410 [Dufourea novaeangliae]